MKKKKPYIIGIILLLVILLALFVLFELYKLSDENSNITSKAKEYSRHYVLISNNTATAFWKSVYKSAKKEADANDIYLEQVGSNLSEEYSMKDYLRISIASKVDGIIVSPDGSTEVSNLIDEASRKGIPVVTVLNDASNTKRVSFIGLNSYELGLIYAQQIKKQITEDTRTIYILFHSAEGNSTNDVVFNQIKIALNKYMGNRRVNILPYYVSNNNEFDSEEAIRDIFVSSASIPDILVCMEEVDTECVCQAIVDYNKVGKVKIIGSYSSDIILGAVKKKLAALTVAMDTKQLGKQCIQALNEYHEMGYVNNYFNVDLNIINQNNVDSYLKE